MLLLIKSSLDYVTRCRMKSFIKCFLHNNQSSTCYDISMHKQFAAKKNKQKKQIKDVLGQNGNLHLIIKNSSQKWIMQVDNNWMVICSALFLLKNTFLYYSTMETFK